MNILFDAKNPQIAMKDAFISYRRSGGATVGRLLCDALNSRHITTFFDKESLGAGNFDEAIEANLRSARNFILVVSPGMFGRGLTAQGIYDELEISKDWVYREIKIAMEIGKPVIPVFVNGVSKFPALLPPGLEGLSQVDALTLGHDHFEPELRKLISRLKTNRDQLIEEYISALDGDAELLLQTCLRIGGEERKSEINSVISGKIRQFMYEGSRDLQSVVEAIFEGANIIFEKDLCRKLWLDNRGDSKRLRSNLLAWVTNLPYEAYSGEAGKIDRFDEVCDAFGDYFGNRTDREKAKEVAEQLGIEVNTVRSSRDIYVDVFTALGVEGFFKQKINLAASDLKAIASYLMGDESIAGKSKADVIALIIDYVNYEFDHDEDQQLYEEYNELKT